MNTHKTLRAIPVLSLGAVLLATLIGCGGIVTKGGGNGDGGDGGSGGDAGSGGSGIAGAGGSAGGDSCDPSTCPAPTGAIAMTWAQYEAASGSGGSSNSGGGGSSGGPDPSTQFLMWGAGTETPACNAPHGNGACGGWSVSVRLDPAAFQVGVHPFADPAVDITFSESTDEGNNECSGGGGGGLDSGQIDILDITATTVEFEVLGVDSFFSFPVDGHFTAARCP